MQLRFALFSGSVTTEPTAKPAQTYRFEPSGWSEALMTVGSAGGEIPVARVITPRSTASGLPSPKVGPCR